MATNPQNADPNVTAHRVVTESTQGRDELPADMEAAWHEWSSHLQRVDERALTLLKAAFEAGWNANIRP